MKAVPPSTTENSASTAGSDELLRPADMAATWRTWRFLGAAHVAGLLMFILMMAGFLWYVSSVEKQERRDALKRDADWAQQSLKLSLHELQDSLSRRAPLWLARQKQSTLSGSAQGPASFMASQSQIRYLALTSPEGRISAVFPSQGAVIDNALSAGDITQTGGTMLLPAFERARPDSARQTAYRHSQKSWLPRYSTPLMIPGGEVVTELYLPIIQGRKLTGMLIAGIGLDPLLQAAIPPNVRAKYRFSVLNALGNELVSTSSSRRIDTLIPSYALSLQPPGGELVLRATPYEDDTPRLAERLTQLGLFTLSLTSILSLILLWRSAQDRFHIEAERDRLFLLSQDVFCVIQPDGTLVRGNPAFVEYFGADTTNTRFWDHVHPDDRADVMQILSGTDGQIGPLECRVRYRNAWRWMSWSISIDRRSPEALLYAVAHDITARKHIEHALTTETTFRRAMEDSISTGMRVIDQEGRITYVNRAFCQMLGYSAEELIGQLPPYPYWLPDKHELALTHINRIISGRAPHSGIQTQVCHKDGRIIDIRIYVSPLIDDLGQQAGWMASVTDITEPNRIRAELSAAHERFNTVLNELGSAVSVATLGATPMALATGDGTSAGPPESRPAEPARLLFSNRQYRALFGEQISGHLALLKGWPAAEHWVGEEVHVPSIDRWFEVRAQHIRWVDGKSAQLVVATDITALRPIWEQQKQQQEQLQQTARLVTMGEMASSIAHELNQPLAAISNYSLGLANRVRQPGGIANEQISETLDKIAKQAQRAAAVIRRVRDFVRRNVPEQQQASVNDILSETLGLAEIAAKRYGVKISIDLQPGLPLLRVDRILIEQVLLNLLKNAIDAMRGTSQPALTVSVSASSNQVEFAVADLGPGLAEEMQNQVFEPFFTTKSEGMGMGLNICRSIIESHAGRLWVEPNQPHGCIFRFSLPACAPESPTITTRQPQ